MPATSAAHAPPSDPPPAPPQPPPRTLRVGDSNPDARADRTSLDDDYAGVDPDQAEAMLGRILAGRYEITRVLGRGGMGLVYEAKHVTVGRRVAVKVLRRDLARSTQAVARFHREAQAAARAGSEHIVEVFDFGYSEEGDAYIVMELLEGENLGATVRAAGRLELPRALAIARQIARALGEAHAKGIIHRDLKSENVFVVRRDGHDFIKLLDFGISKISEGEEGRGPMTTQGVVMGTPFYMAPEQAMSDVEPDQRIDLYALGCIIYEMLTGRVPFRGRNPVEVVFKHVHEPVVPASQATPEAGIPVEVDAIVLKLLAKNRDDRYANAAAFLASLATVAAAIEGAWTEVTSGVGRSLKPGRTSGAGGGAGGGAGAGSGGDATAEGSHAQGPAATQSVTPTPTGIETRNVRSKRPDGATEPARSRRMWIAAAALAVPVIVWGALALRDGRAGTTTVNNGRGNATANATRADASASASADANSTATATATSTATSTSTASAEADAEVRRAADDANAAAPADGGTGTAAALPLGANDAGGARDRNGQGGVRPGNGTATTSNATGADASAGAGAGTRATHDAAGSDGGAGGASESRGDADLDQLHNSPYGRPR